ncbi:hypothetical protein Q3G72_031622 [Acer saccharum]|nr:hypothetical protein Q3G72_031622 [Acer saccharum]
MIFSSHLVPTLARQGKPLRSRIPIVTIKAQTATTTTAINQAAPEEKKTMRKGNVIATGASSGLGLATAKALAETGNWHAEIFSRPKMQLTYDRSKMAVNVPPKALRGLSRSLNRLNSSPMIDGGEFDGAKAYKDSKVCNMLTMQEFHRRFNEDRNHLCFSLPWLHFYNRLV